MNIFKLSLIACAVAALTVFLSVTVSEPYLAFAAVFSVLFIVLLSAGRLRPHAEVAPPGAPVASGDSLPAGFGRALLERLPIPLVVIDRRGRIIYANTACSGLGTALRIGDHFATAFRAPAFVETVGGVVADGAARVCTYAPPGGDRVFEAQVAELPSGAGFGEDRQLIAMLLDRTEQIRADAIRSDFIANASHELRTPLASVLGYIETLQGHARDDPEARARFLEIMASQAGRMNRLVEDLLSLSRIERDARLKPNEVSDLNAAVREAAGGLRPVAAARGSELRLDMPDGPMMVRGDRDQLIQLATNLIDNAIKYGRSKPVQVTSRLDGDMAVVEIADQGIGIAREHISRLTERFYRVNVSESRKVGGTGLGLAIVKHILNRHGGTLQIDSTPGEGSRFSFRLQHVANDRLPVIQAEGSDKKLNKTTV